METATELSADVGVPAACDALGIARSSFYHHRSRKTAAAGGAAEGSAQRPRPARALTAQERQAVLNQLDSERFADCSAPQVYTTLLDEGVYLCSPRTMYRLLEANNQLRERRNQRRHPAYAAPELVATAEIQVWSWDITKLKGPVAGTCYHLYVILDIYSRYVVGWMVADRESEELAGRLIAQTCHRQSITAQQLTLHADRGSSMRSASVAELLSHLEVRKSHSRPYCSNDNPYSESQFKTMKYRPAFPARFGLQEDAQAFCQAFFAWYNHEHHHSGIAMLTPAMVHYQCSDGVITQRDKGLSQAYERHPERFVHNIPTAQRLPLAVWINKPMGHNDHGNPTVYGPESTVN